MEVNPVPLLGENPIGLITNVSNDIFRASITIVSTHKFRRWPPLHFSEQSAEGGNETSTVGLARYEDREPQGSILKQTYALAQLLTISDLITCQHLQSTVV